MVSDKNYIKLKNPRIVYENDKSRLYMDTVLPENRKAELWFEVEEKYGKYLYEDRADPFLLAILPYCMVRGFHIEIDKATGVSADLLYQLINILIPSLKREKRYNQIKIVSKAITKKLKAGNGVATGITRGVDSFYTVLKNIDSDFPLSHLTLFNVQGFGEYGGEIARNNFRKDIKEASRVCHELSLQLNREVPFITVDSNIHEVFPVTINDAGTYRDMSAVILLKQLFCTYYFSSGWLLEEFSMDIIRKSEPWILYCLSTENLRLQLFGADMSRLEKIKYISHFPITYDSLQICHQPVMCGTKGIENSHERNCTLYCEKCRKTVLGLIAAGALEKYETVFNLKLIKEHYIQYMEELVQKRNQEFFEEIYRDFERQGKIPCQLKERIVVEYGCSKKDEPADKDAKIVDYLDRMLYLKGINFSLKEKLIELGYKKVALYGVGRIGKRLYDELGDMVSYGIDQRVIAYRHLKILRPESEYRNVDLVIITSAFEEEIIRGYLEKKLSCEIWNMSQFLFAMEELVMCEGGNQVVGNLKGCRINWKGNNSTIHVGEGFCAEELVIDIWSNVHITIGKNICVKEGCLWRFYEGAKCIIDDGVSWNQTGSEMILRENAYIHIGNGVQFYKNNLLVVHENTSLMIGRDSIFARDTIIRTDDGHPIYDVNTGLQSNKNHSERSVQIGEHVWIGQGAMILYSSVIGNGTIIGARSLIKGVFPNNCIVVGQADMARIVKRDVAWKFHEDEEGLYGLPEKYRRKTKDRREK